MRRRIPVVILGLIFLTILALVVLAAQKARGNARRYECFRNLKQISIALSNSHDLNNTFPSATMRTDRLRPDQRFSWQFELIPLMEATFLRVDKDKPWDDPANWPMRGIRKFSHEIYEIPPPLVIKLFVCPANPATTTANNIGMSHYVGIAGLGLDAASLPKSDLRAGIFGYDREFRREEVPNPSNTMMVAETATNNGPWLAGGFPTVRGLDPGKPPYMGPEGQFSSYHSMGRDLSLSTRSVSNVLFVDSSVRRISDGIDSALFELLATVNGTKPAERIGED